MSCRPSIRVALAVGWIVFAPQSAAAQNTDGRRASGADAAPTRESTEPPRFFGPLTTEEAGPLQRVSYTHTVEGADLVPAGTLQAEFWFGFTNIFEQDSAATHELFLDMERLSTTAGVRVGLSDRLELGGRLSFETTGGGFLDGFISRWHTTLGLGNANREKYPSDDYAYRLVDGRGRVRIDVPNGTMMLEDLRLFAKWRAWRSDDRTTLLSFRGVTRIPTRENRVGAQRTDFSLMALLRASDPPWHFHGTVGGATVRAARDYAGLLRDAAFFLDLAAERNLASWVSAVVQVSAGSPRLQGFDNPELDGWPVNLVFGLTGEVGGWRVDASFQEDIPPNTPAVDFTLGIGVRRRF